MKTIDLIHSNVRKPARYAGPEYYPAGRREPNPGDALVALIYPDTYEVGMSNTGLRILYSLLAREKGIHVDTAFAPWADFEDVLRQKGEVARSRQGQLPLADFDVLGFSLQYELNYTNVLTLLDLAGLPVRAAHRNGEEPLILGGGPCATHPEPIAPFFDALVAGDGEEALLAVVRSWQATAGEPRPARLAALADLPGVYVPARHEPTPADGRLVHPDLAVAKQSIRDLDGYEPFVEFPVPAVETVFDRLSLELARGCHQGCRFCEAGFTYRPPRERAPGYLLRWATETLEKTGLTELSMASLSSADYSQLLPLVRTMRQEARQRRVSLTVSSLRAYGLPDEVLEALNEARVSSLTLAPEAGSQRLRNLINKNVTEEQILASVERIVASGINRIKLYFMIGLPTEEVHDLNELTRLVHNCYDVVRRRYRNKAAVVASVSMFVPRPHTPFQWEGMDSLADLEQKISHLRSRLNRKGITVRWHNPEMSRLEALLTRGDRSLADVIEDAWRAGARFDSWDEVFRMDLWRTAIAKHGIEFDDFLSPVPTDTSLPWNHLRIEVNEDFLRRERERAFAGKVTKPCTPFAPEFVCYRCGAECPQPKGLPEPGPTVPEPEPTSPLPQPGPERRFRILYAKTGPAALLGHLDILRQLTLVFRRAGWEFSYTRGYHPRPKFSFPPPLPLGQFGLAEPAEVHAVTAPETDDPAGRLNRYSVPGLHFLAVEELAPGAPKVSKVVAARYLLAPAAGSPAGADLVDAITALGHDAVLGSEVAESPEADLPEAPHGLVAVDWAVASAPRIDRVLMEALPELALLWVARERVTAAPRPEQKEKCEEEGPEKREHEDET